LYIDALKPNLAMNWLKIALNAVILSVFFCFSCACDIDHRSTIKTRSGISSDTSKYDSTVFASAYSRLRAGKQLSPFEIEKFADGIDTRQDFYNLLDEVGELKLFPAKYNTFEKAAETIMTGWLLFPTELDTVPSKIELVESVSFSEHDSLFTYYVMRFKTEEPHWAAKDGWMVGVVGPYFATSHPYDWTSGTFSRFTRIDETTPEKEVKWVHENVYRKNPK
jgi:hypothetical protein